RDMPGKAAAGVAALAFALALAPDALAQDLSQPIEEGVREQSCKALTGGTAGVPDQAPAETGAEFPSSWTPAPAGLLPDHVYLRTQTETFNRLYEFATRNGTIYGRKRDTGTWRELPLP